MDNKVMVKLFVVFRPLCECMIEVDSVAGQLLFKIEHICRRDIGIKRGV